jgi:Family of unknown function (DUF6152)
MRAEVLKSSKSPSKRSFILAGFVAVALSTSAAWAHHSFAMFDFTRVVTIKGSVKEFQWANPHVILWVDPDAKDGAKPGPWFAELTSPGNLTRVGWDKRVFKGGDRVELVIHPLRDGKSGGAFKQVTLLDTGKVWTSDLRAQEKPGLK